jgi:hypothetical protein
MVFFAFLVGKSQFIKKIDVTEGRLLRVTPAVRDLPDMQSPPPANFRKLMSERNTEDDGVMKIYSNKTKPDPVLQRRINNLNGPNGANGGLGMNESTINKIWDGMTAPGVSPTDPCMAAGPNHIIQMVNGSVGSQIGGFFRIYDKSGNALTSAIFMQTLSGLPGYGDCVPMYDRIADRFVITEMPNPTLAAPYNVVMLVSKSNDPTGQWYIYSFSVTNQFPDYPKYAVWSNAYYGTGNNYLNAGSYSGSCMWAFERTKMLAGDNTAKLINVTLTDPDSKFFTVAPVTYQAGPAPAATVPGMFMYINADETTASTTDVDSIGLMTFLPDFTTPANSTITRMSMVVAPFNATVCGATRGQCIAQPGTAVNLEALHWKLMHHLVYRDFGTYQTILASQTVNAGAGVAGVRWYEFRNNGSGYTVYQQGTYSPDNTNRWMPSISINGKGEIALAYMVSNASNVYPGIRFAGRKATDPLGQLITYDETSAYDGVGSQTQNNRSGDYNDLSVDPVDDTTFWFTSQYYGLPTLFGGYTKILNFDLAEPKDLDARLLSIVSPPNGNAACTNTITPIVSLKNSGLLTLTSLTLNVKVDNNAPITSSWTGSLPLGSTTQVTLPAFTAAGGSHTLTIYSSNPNGSPDMNPVNDTAKSSFTVLVPQASPIIEGFENASFPTNNWRVVNPNSGSITWTRTTLAAKTGTASEYINLYNYANTGDLDYLLSPILNTTGVDSVLVSFDRAYVRYSTGTTFSDTLMIQVSTDCGNTFPITAWKKGGNDLATRSGTNTGNWFPVAADWGTEKVDLKPFIGNANSITVSFTTKNGYGQNLFLDNINISTVTLLRRDARPTQVIDPFSRLCARTVLPSFQFGSYGKDTLKSLQIVFNITGTSYNYSDTIAWTGSLVSGQTATVTVPTNKIVNLPSAGSFNLKVFTYKPNGLDDQVPANDTLLSSFKVFDPQPGPIKEGFESPTFPPANWDVSNSNPTYGWQRTTLGSTQGLASAIARDYRYNGNNASDAIYSPIMQVTNVDSVFLTFDRAHMPAKYPGSTSTPLDTLEVLITTDCGKTFTSVYKKTGEELQSVNDPNFPGIYPATDTIGFRPSSASQWKKDSVNLTPWVGANNKFQVVFKNTSNKGNNVYLDNINLYSVTLPAKLKQNGYLISPNPFNGWISVRHYLRPVDLRGIEIINAAGQKMWEMNFSGNALSNIQINLSGFAAGVYMMKLVYTNKVITERIVKRQ